LGGDPGSSRLRFEAVYPTGLPGTPPHLDVVIDGGTTRLAVESKFLESYSPASNRFRRSYFSTGHVWDGLPACRALAKQIAGGEQMYRWLGAAQLLKHAVGLSKTRIPFRLVLVWYRVDGSIAAQLDEEIERFSQDVAADIDFAAISYQQLFDRLRTVPGSAPGYFDYLTSRYFPA
jgi:hypothetical protein